MKYFFQAFLFFSNAVFSQTSGWMTNPFDQKVFIENKGQFDKKLNNEGKIIFGASIEGIEFYFTPKGLTYKHDEFIPMTEVENEGEEERKMIKPIPHYLSMEWVGANPNAEIIAEESVSSYYTYGGKDAGTAIKANAYKKIIYKNLYPNIDVEYIFPSDSSGIKYSVILHPGADPAVIGMRYIAAESVSLDSNGNAVIKSSFGEFVDHAPQTFYKDNGKPIASCFSVKNNIVSFSLPAYSNASGRLVGAVIDPWVTNPVFASFNSAYDVNYDLNGNVYIYGSYTPFKLAKINSAGTLQWIFNATSLAGFGGTYSAYGDFALDEVSGTSYLVEGFRNLVGSRILKVNTLGNLTSTFPGNANMTEMWRAEYNRCIKKIVVGGGGTQVTYQAAMLDTNMINITPVNILSATQGLHDVTLLSIDNNSNFCYMATAKTDLGSQQNFFDNTLIKCPITPLVPLAFSVPDGHKFVEAFNVTYIGTTGITNNGSKTNGMNGMVVSPAWLYTYDSDSLKRWDKNSGAFMNGIDVSPTLPAYGSKNQILVSWGGISADECDNIYVGVGSTVKEYNTSLSLINTFTLPDTVYDVKKGLYNRLYACGKGFVTEIEVPVNVPIVQTPASCNLCDATATANISCGTISNFKYSWSTSPLQTTKTATGLCPGSYTVTIMADTINCSMGFLATGTVAITTSNSLTVALTSQGNVACFGGNNGSAAVNVAGGGTAPYTYAWNTAPVQSTATATGLSAGIYTITITDVNNCSSTQTVAIAQPPALTLTPTVTQTTCNAGTGTATPNPGGGSPAYTYAWSNGQITSTATGLIAATYTVTIRDSANCSIDTALTITMIPCPCTDLTLPNAFSPNADGENDEFCLPVRQAGLQGGTEYCISELKIIIYNRWGEQVYRSSDKKFCWDGWYKNNLQNTAVFVYYLDATLINDKKITKSGNVSLIR